jgi:hypothetical protein
LYLALLGAGFRRQTTYRLALAAGLATAAFFGVVRMAVFFALYREQDQVAGLDVADAVTYVWILQGLFAVVWAPWFWEQAEAIRSGEFVVELLRPGDPYLRLAAFDLGRALSLLVTRTVPVLAVAALVLPCACPAPPAGWRGWRPAWSWPRRSASSSGSCSGRPPSGRPTTGRCSCCCSPCSGWPQGSSSRWTSSPARCGPWSTGAR